MPSTFYALPLPRRGESFLLRTIRAGAEFTVLVDVGWRALQDERGLSLCVRLDHDMPELRVIDRLVVTHEDSDHCEGGSQFVEAWTASGRTIREVWLPALWSVAAGTPLRSGYSRGLLVGEAVRAAPSIEAALRRPDEVDALKDEADADDPSKPHLRGVGTDVDRRLPSAIRQVAREAGVDTTTLFVDRLNVCDAAGAVDPTTPAQDRVEAAPTWLMPGHRVAGHHRPLQHSIREAEWLAARWALRDGSKLRALDPLARQLSAYALDTHDRIAPLIAACIRKDIAIRWFDYEAFTAGSPPKAAGGDPGSLVPVNAREIRLRGGPLSIKAIFYALSLSRANRQSLVMYAPYTDTEPAVLFTADSKLKDGWRAFPAPTGLPPGRRLLTTAMHHASSSNAVAYGVLRGWLGGAYPPIFVRNGGHGVLRVASEFLAASDRQCVSCSNDAARASLIRFDAVDGEWRLSAHPKRCVCSDVHAAATKTPARGRKRSTR